MTFVGPFLLRYKNDASGRFITIRSASSKLPPEGHRVNPSFSAEMPKLVTVNYDQVFKTELRVENGVAKPAHHYYLMGLEIFQQGNVNSYALIRLGRYKELDGFPEQTSYDRIPHDFVIDRCFIHGNPEGNVKNAIEMQSARTSVINSHISEIHSIYNESHGIIGLNGSGPFKIVNNVIEGSTSNILFGGANPQVPGLVPSDIEIRHNVLSKPLEWYGTLPHRSVKNLFELKNARRVIFDRNLLENNWADGQNGTAIQLTPRNDDGEADWSTVEDVTLSNNVIRRTFHGLTIARSRNGSIVEQPPQRIKIINNLFTEIDPSAWCGNCDGISTGKFISNFQDSIDVRIEHNTILHTGSIVTASGVPNTGFVFKNNLIPHNDYGFQGADVQIGNSTLATYFPGAEFRRNVLVNNTDGLNLNNFYPTNNEFPENIASSFIDGSNADRNLRNYRLIPNSGYRNQADDGRDIGANIDLLNAALKSSDFDSDGKTEIAVFRPSEGSWYIRNSADGSNRSYRFGLAGDVPTAGDYDGDGQSDYAVYRPSTGTWYILRSSDSQYSVSRFGVSEDIPVPADYDADGKTDIAVFRPSSGTWYVQGTRSGVIQARFGMNGDKPVAADYDGDGRTDFAVWRPSTGEWFVYQSFSRNYRVMTFGMNGDIPVYGDFNGDQRLDIGVFRPSEGTWYLNDIHFSSLTANRFGMPGDTPIIGDFDGDGKTDLSVWRPGTGVWYSQRSTAGFSAVNYGMNGDIPVSNAVLAR
ncbi:MAG: VCBS repeat-containing protein [Pyrinomonadaceae bacterium]|nr:VCBS repeat-containing protein [Pyrinomonadaceae bacterium]